MAWKKAILISSRPHLPRINFVPGTKRSGGQKIKQMIRFFGAAVGAAASAGPKDGTRKGRAGRETGRAPMTIAFYGKPKLHILTDIKVQKACHPQLCAWHEIARFSILVVFIYA